MQSVNDTRAVFLSASVVGSETGNLLIRVKKTCFPMGGLSSPDILKNVFVLLLMVCGLSLGCARKAVVEQPYVPAKSKLADLFPTQSEVPFLLRPPEPKYVPPDKFGIYLGIRGERYKLYGVKEIMYLSYYWGDSTRYMPVVDMEIIRLPTPEDAFGIFSIERPIITEETVVNSRGYITATQAGFWWKDLYIRILAPTDSELHVRALHAVAQRTLERLPPGPPLPPGFGRLPVILRIPFSEVFIRRRVLGYPFLEGGYFADYDFGGRIATAFVCAFESEEDAERRFSAFFEAIRIENARVAFLTGVGDRAFIARGSRYGNVLVFQRNHFVAGLLAMPAVVGDFLSRFDAILKTSQ